MERKPRAGKKIVLIVVIIAVVALGVYRIMESMEPPVETEKTPVNVVTAVVEKGNIYATSPLTGRIDPVDSAAVVPLTAGEVTKVAVSLGDYVKKGALLFELDKTQMATTYNSAKIAYESARKDYERMKVLYQEGAISLQQYQGIEAQFNVAKENLNAAAEALSYCTVTSPIDGYITSVNISEGSIASQAAPAITVADVSKLEINTTISEYLINKVKAGDPVDIFIKTLSKDPYPGTIKAISPAPALGTLTYPITITVDDSSGEIKAGMFAEVQIVSDMKEDVICVPSDAIFIRSGESKVVVLNGNVPSIVTVETGLDNGVMAEVVSGLNVGDVIVVSGQQYVIDGEPVNIIE
ncbi:MAG: efflux RND transporter periplasmic adaptor subunit [Anaerovoracaceae bacterium]